MCWLFTLFSYSHHRPWEPVFLMLVILHLFVSVFYLRDKWCLIQQLIISLSLMDIENRLQAVSLFFLSIFYFVVDQNHILACSWMFATDLPNPCLIDPCFSSPLLHLNESILSIQLHEACTISLLSCHVHKNNYVQFPTECKSRKYNQFLIKY